MSLLPQTILPQSEPFGTVNAEGKVTIDQNWWLLLYNLCLQILGAGQSQGLPSNSLQELAGADSDAADTDAIVLRQPSANALVQAMQPSDVVVSSADLPDIARALLLAQEPTLSDPVPLAQPVSTITVGGSPFTYTASFDGSVVVTAGTVSAIAIIRQGTNVATGITAGIFPISRFDQLKVTYSVTPTMTFIPRSSQ